MTFPAAMLTIHRCRLYVYRLGKRTLALYLPSLDRLTKLLYYSVSDVSHLPWTRFGYDSVGVDGELFSRPLQSPVNNSLSDFLGHTLRRRDG